MGDGRRVNRECDFCGTRHILPEMQKSHYLKRITVDVRCDIFRLHVHRQQKHTLLGNYISTSAIMVLSLFPRE